MGRTRATSGRSAYVLTYLTILMVRNKIIGSNLRHGSGNRTVLVLQLQQTTGRECLKHLEVSERTLSRTFPVHYFPRTFRKLTRLHCSQNLRHPPRPGPVPRLRRRCREDLHRRLRRRRCCPVIDDRACRELRRRSSRRAPGGRGSGCSPCCQCGSGSS